MKTHDTQKPFQCTVCNRGYNTAAALTSHMQNHKKQISSTSEANGANGSNGISFRCLQCTESFQLPEELQRHTSTEHSAESQQASRLAHNSTPYGCDMCTMRFPSLESLQRHNLIAHPTNSPTPEQLTPTDLSKKTAKRRRTAEPEHPTPQYMGAGPLLCNQCSAVLPDFEAFRTHLKIHLQQNGTVATIPALSCVQCGAVCPDAGALERHVAAHFLSTTSEFGCQNCRKIFQEPESLHRHLLEQHTTRVLRCSLCRELFESEASIRLHFAVKHSQETRLFRCTACGAETRSEREFRQHVRLRHPLTPPHAPTISPLSVIPSTRAPLRCAFCRAACATELEMHFHLAAHARQFRCPLCPEAFHVEFLLDRHLQTRHSQQPMPAAVPDIQEPLERISPTRTNDNNNARKNCDICDRDDFMSESELAAHRKLVHHLKGASRVSPHCAYCNEPFRSRAELETHIKTAHRTSASSKHKCVICDEVFPAAAVLAEHKLSHCKVGPGGRCAQCGALFADEQVFRAHLSQHSGRELPAPCPVCRQTLSTDLEVGLHARFHLKTAVVSTRTHCSLCRQPCEVSEVSGSVCRNCCDSGRTRTITETWSCAQCRSDFDTEQQVQAHVALHESRDSSLQCRLCAYRPAGPQQLQAHLIEHTFAGCDSRGFSCYICSAVFTNAPGLLQHLSEHGPQARLYECSRCDMRFYFRAELDNHSYTHAEADAKSDDQQVQVKAECSDEYIEVASPRSSTPIEPKVGMPPEPHIASKSPVPIENPVDKVM